MRAETSNSATVVNSRIRGQNNNNPITFSTQADFDARAWLPGVVDWDAISAWVGHTDYDSPDISTIIQAIIDLAGWASGNALVLAWDDWDERSTQSNGTWRNVTHYDLNTEFAPKLYIEYTTVTYKELAGVSNGVASASGSIVRELAFSGLSAGVCSVSGFTAIDRALAGLSQGIASVSGAIVRDLALAGISSGIASVSATLQRVRELSGAAAGIALVTGNIIISPGVWLSGASAGVALVSGSLSRIRVLAGISAGVSSVSGLLGILKLLSGLSAGVATVTGRLGRKILAIRNLAAVRNLPPVRTLPWE
ncbi:hypothetical protein ES708_26877 [subsurface metagenome]